MSGRAKFIIVNLGIIAGLVLEFFRGIPMIALIISALVLIPLANVLMVRKYRTQSDS